MSETTETHLTTFDRSRIACGDWEPDAAATQHLQGCAWCADKIAEESAQVKAMAYAPVPSDILALARQPKVHGARWRAVWGAAATMGIAVLTMMVVPRSENRVRLKGGVTGKVAISVMRGNQLVFDDEAMENVQSLQPGDLVRFHVLNPTMPYVAVQTENLNGWDNTFGDKPPVNGWLPFALAMDNPAVVKMRLFTCSATPPSTLEAATEAGTCDMQTFTLGR